MGGTAQSLGQEAPEEADVKAERRARAERGDAVEKGCVRLGFPLPLRGSCGVSKDL